MENVLDNYHQVLENIEHVARDAGRELGAVRLVAVSKGQPLEKIRRVVEAGARLLGENYVEEALSKISVFQDFPGLEWHMIGHLQSRKARLVCEHFSCLHTLDSLKLATRLNRFADDLDRTLPCLLECNVSGEETKYGWRAWNEAEWSQLVPELEPLLDFPRLQIQGLMTMAPYFQEPEQARPYFNRLRRLRNFLATHLSHGVGDDLSMGMSNDYVIAIQEGATIVRIGTAIFGERSYS